MSMHVIGFRPPDEKWRKMSAVYHSCVSAGIDPPNEVHQFFDYCPPDLKGIEVELPLIEWNDSGREGFDLEIAKIPEKVTHIRFYSSW